MCSNVPDDGSQTRGKLLGKGPHSSKLAPFSTAWLRYQQVVANDPSESVSTRNLFRRELSGSVDGGMKSQGTTTKSSVMRFENCRRRAHVPVLPSSASSYVCKSTLRDEEETSECMW